MRNADPVPDPCAGVAINGVQHSLWRAVDHDGQVLDILVQPRRDKRAAVRFLRKLLTGLRAACGDHRQARELRGGDAGSTAQHRAPVVQGLNNRAENTRQPTREREHRRRRFKSSGYAQRFLAAYGPIASYFRPRRHRLTAAAYRWTRAERFATWRAVTGTPAIG